MKLIKKHNGITDIYEITQHNERMRLLPRELRELHNLITATLQKEVMAKHGLEKEG